MMTIIPPSHAVLRSWNILINVKDVTEHFVGYDQNILLGRMSTAIISFDEEKGMGETLSGSTYETVGKPGRIHDDALYVLERVIGGQIDDYKWKYPTKTR